MSNTATTTDAYTTRIVWSRSRKTGRPYYRYIANWDGSIHKTKSAATVRHCELLLADA